MCDNTRSIEDARLETFSLLHSDASSYCCLKQVVVEFFPTHDTESFAHLKVYGPPWHTDLDSVDRCGPQRMRIHPQPVEHRVSLVCYSASAKLWPWKHTSINQK